MQGSISIWVCFSVHIWVSEETGGSDRLLGSSLVGKLVAPRKSVVVFGVRAIRIALFSKLSNAFHRLLILEARFLRSDSLLLRHHEVVTVIETGEVVTSRVVLGNNAALEISAF